MGSVYEIVISEQAADELTKLRPFDQRPLIEAIRRLATDAETATRNRKPLQQPLEDLPAASWQIRIGKHRVLYEVKDHRAVNVLRVIIKIGTTAESL